jgi:predicted enzyme related to lactoylglutathione lyase
MELTNITFDAIDPGRLAAFWAAATGRQLAESTPDVAVLTSATEPVRLLFLKVLEGKTGKNRMHLDFQAADRAAEVARVRGLGATEHATHQEYGLTWTVMTDPEGNEFCIVQA